MPKEMIFSLAGGVDTSVPPRSVVRLASILRKLNRKVLLVYRENGGYSPDYADTTAALEFVIRSALKMPLATETAP